jgi:hypothetical protein
MRSYSWISPLSVPESFSLEHLLFTPLPRTAHIPQMTMFLVLHSHLTGRLLPQSFRTVHILKKRPFPPLVFGVNRQQHKFRKEDILYTAGILMRKKQIAVIALALWLSIVSFFMLLAQQFDLELLFVLWLIGILVIVELIKPTYVQPGYLRYIRYLIAAGIVIFGAIIAQKVIEIITS